MVLVVLAVIWLVGETADASMAEHEVEEQVATRTDGVTATIDTSALPPLAVQVVSAAASNVRVSRNALHIGPVSFLLSSDVLPCAPDVRVADGAVVLVCEIDEVPPALVDAR